MDFYDGFDLETAAVIQLTPSDPIPAEVDFVFAYNSTEVNPVVMFQQNGAEIAFLDGTAFDDVSCLVDGTRTFSGALNGSAFDPDDTIIVKTPLGNQFKVGRPAYGGSGPVTFSYSRLQ